MWTLKLFLNAELVFVNQYPSEKAAEDASRWKTSHPEFYGAQALILDPSGELCY